MGKGSHIGWTDNTFNAWWGCRRYDEMCIYCYAERLDARYDKNGHWGNNDRKMMSENYWKQPLAWNKEAEKNGIKTKVFCSSMADVFEDNDQVIEARNRLWKLIKQTPNLNWQILTKRYDRIAQFLPDDWNGGYENVWLGISVGLQKRVDEYLPTFIEIPAKTRFLSCEPLIGELDLTKYLKTGKIHQVITGGESGFGSHPEDKNVKFRYRECKIEWIEKIVSQCKETNTSIFVKQLGTHLAKTMNLNDRAGSDINEFPENIRYQQFPK